jgi:hypothetical protein
MKNDLSFAEFGDPKRPLPTKLAREEESQPRKINDLRSSDRHIAAPRRHRIPSGLDGLMSPNKAADERMCSIGLLGCRAGRELRRYSVLLLE